MRSLGEEKKQNFLGAQSIKVSTILPQMGAPEALEVSQTRKDSLVIHGLSGLGNRRRSMLRETLFRVRKTKPLLQPAFIDSTIMLKIARIQRPPSPLDTAFKPGPIVPQPSTLFRQNPLHPSLPLHRLVIPATAFSIPILLMPPPPPSSFFLCPLNSI